MSEHDEDHKKESNPVGETEASGKKKMSKKEGGDCRHRDSGSSSSDSRFGIFCGA